MSSTVPSTTGPSRTSQTSSISKRRTGLLALMVRSLVSTVSLLTFMKQRTKPMTKSFESEPSSSSSRYANSLLSSSSESSADSSPPAPFGMGFSHLRKKLMNSDLSTRPSLFLSMDLNIASGARSFLVWWYRIILIARARNASTSAVSFLEISARNFATLASHFEIWLSNRDSCPPSFDVSASKICLSSGSSGSPRLAIIARTASTEAFASFTNSSTSPASGAISDDVMVLALASMGIVAASSFLTSSAASVAFFAASSVISLILALCSTMCFSLASRVSRRRVSLAFSRETPTRVLSRWNEAMATPLLPSSTRVFKILSMSATGTVNENSPFA
mmetsp:Transcript_49149/g.137639  ORF Transcript_49149/g.137639 Transcript_49149/m.137639 type:complete len:334 (-) Transcript_49149:300-1301(-)